MSQILFQRLFLLELLVQDVTYSDLTTLSPDFLNSLGPTYVEFSSDNFPYIDMSEDEFGANAPFDSYKVKFRSGKSCLFALKKDYVPVSDKAQISVSRANPPGGCSPYYKFGTAYMRLSPGFLSVLYDYGSGTSNSKCLKVCLDILNCQMVPVGVISIFLRLTCFGTSIFTQFQINTSDNKTFNFRGDSVMAPFNGNGSNKIIGKNGEVRLCDPPLPCPATGYSTQNAQILSMMAQMKEELLVDLVRVFGSYYSFNNSFVSLNRGQPIQHPWFMPICGSIPQHGITSNSMNKIPDFSPGMHPGVHQQMNSYRTQVSPYNFVRMAPVPMAYNRQGSFINKPFMIKPFADGQPDTSRNMGFVMLPGNSCLAERNKSENILNKSVYSLNRIPQRCETTDRFQPAYHMQRY